MTGRHSSITPSARLEKKKKSPGVLTLCFATTGNRTRVCFTSKRGVSVSTTFRLRALWAPRTERRVAPLDIEGLVHVPPAYCSCENRERVDDFRRQEFHILGYPTSDRSACAILLRDDAIVLAGRYSTTRPWLPNVWTCFPYETKRDRDVYVPCVCTPLLSVMGQKEKEHPFFT